MLVVFSHKPVRDHEVVDVMEDKGAAGAVEVFLLEEVEGVVAPVAAGVEVVGSMVAVVEAVAVALEEGVRCCMGWGKEGGLTGTSIKVMLERRSEVGSTSSTKACWPQLPTIIPIRICRSGSSTTKSEARKLCLVAK